MRLRWAVADPAAQARLLAAALGSDPTPDGTGWILVLDGGRLEITESAAGDEQLTIEDAPAASGPLRGDATDPPHVARPALIAVGLATVDRERCARDNGWRPEPVPADDLLGAFAERIPGSPLLLLEPSTEGRLAGALARSGEGPAVLYLRTSATQVEESRAAVVALGGQPSRIAAGPFRREFLLDRGARRGPHAMIVAAGVDPAGTIRP